MQTGIDFLREQVDQAIVLHEALIASMTSHESEADDQRYQDLCGRHAAHMRGHQRLLQAFQSKLGDQPSTPAPADILGAVKRVAGTAVGLARTLADTSQSDYSRLTGDLTLVRQLEVTFRTFRDAGRELGISDLAKLGEIAERHHDEYSAEAKRLLTQLFIERAKDAAAIVRPVTEHHADSAG
jgi:hypothetical protein